MNVAYHPELFGFGADHVTVAAQAVALGLRPSYRPGAHDQFVLEVHDTDLGTVAVDIWPGAGVKAGQGRLSQVAGPFPDGMATDRALAEYSCHVPFERDVRRRDGRVLVHFSVPLSDGLEIALRDLYCVVANFPGPEGVSDYGHAELVDALVGAGLAVPRIPAVLRSRMRTRGAWLWSTVEVTESERMDDFRFRADWSGDRCVEHVTVSHGGEGRNNYALTWRMAYGPLALMVQGAWGGIDDGPPNLADLAGDFGFVARLVRAIEERGPIEHEEPVRRPLRVLCSRPRGEFTVECWDYHREAWTRVEAANESEMWELAAEHAASIRMPG